ncbi:MAG: argininosuccinate synthase [Candidatus Omnitrophota bacterium]|nr:argininosuccinate synthase [Candidatus Omnitrophota bacterium]
MEKVVLAYSGGLDTSVIIPYLKENYNLSVIACTANLGQKIDPEFLEKKARKSGASGFFFEDLRSEFIHNYVFPSLAANALYQGKYPLATALSRPLIAQKVVEIARKTGAKYVSHGCTGKGNDQVRFELTWKALAPDLKIIAPLREWQFKTRDEEIEFAKERGIPVPVTKKSPYSLDENLWGVSIECGVLEDPGMAPPEDAYQITVSPEKAPHKPVFVEIGFENGKPIALNGEKLSGLELIAKLNSLGASIGVGRIDMVEDRTVGLKSREIYEAPAATILITAHRELEKMVISRGLWELKDSLSPRYAWLVYQGAWFSEEKEALDAFFATTQRYVSGKIKVKLYKGGAVVVGRYSPHSLYSEALATYGNKDIFDRTAAAGFIDLLGLPLLLEGRRRSKK